MNKEEFMTRLKELLADLPDDENKQDALNYYQDYLEEAGENTAAVLKEFGSPERIASMIRCDLNGELKIMALKTQDLRNLDMMWPKGWIFQR